MELEFMGSYFDSLASAMSAASEAASHGIEDVGKVITKCAAAVVAQTRRAALMLSSSATATAASADALTSLTAPLRLTALASSSVLMVALLTASLVARRRRQRRMLEEKKRALTARVPEESRARPEDAGSAKDLVAARFFNACMRRFYTVEAVVTEGAACWLRGINAKMKEKDDCRLEFVDIHHVTAVPTIKNAVASWRNRGRQQGPAMKAELHFDTLHFSLREPRGGGGRVRVKRYMLEISDFMSHFDVRLDPFAGVVVMEFVFTTQRSRLEPQDERLLEAASFAAGHAIVHVPLSILALSHPLQKVVVVPSRPPRPPPSTADHPVILSMSNLGVSFHESPGAHVYVVVRLSPEESRRDDVGPKPKSNRAKAKSRATPVQVSSTQTWLAESSDDGTEFCWPQEIHFPIDESQGDSLGLTAEVFREEDDSLIGTFSTSLLISTVSNLQEYQAPLSAPEKAEIFIRVHFKRGDVGNGDARREPRLKRLNSNASSGQHNQHAQQTFDSTSFSCFRSDEGDKGQYAVADTTLWHLKQRRADASAADTPSSQGSMARSVLTISSVSKVPKVSHQGGAECGNEAPSRNSCGMSIGNGIPLVMDCSRRQARNSTSSSVENDLSTCSDCSLEVEADLTGWRGWIADSWDDDDDDDFGKDRKKANGRLRGDEEKIESASVAPVTNGMDDEEPSSPSVGNIGRSCLAGMDAALRGSTLVLQTREGSLHLAEGLSKAERKRLLLRRRRRKEAGAVKLHVAMGHAFVAKHVKGGTRCTVCAKGLLPLPGRQAYVCKDCDAVAHKKCHAAVPDTCPKQTITTAALQNGIEPTH